MIYITENTIQTKRSFWIQFSNYQITIIPQFSIFLNRIEFFNYCTQNISEFKTFQNKLNLSIYEQNEYLNLIENSKDIFQTLAFINNYCKNEPEIERSQALIDRLFNAAENEVDETSYEKLISIDRFLLTCHFFKDLKKFHKLPFYVKSNIKMKLVKGENYTIDEILTYLLNSEIVESKTEQNELLLQEMLKNDELLQIYLSFRLIRNDYYEIKVDDFLSINKIEYHKYQDTFIDIAKQIYILDEKENILIKNSNYDIYNSIKIPEFGSSIVNKLFDRIKKTPESYQSFYILKSIANTFPLLFYNRHQEIFEIALQSFENFLLILDDQNQFKSAQMVYSAFSFFVSTFAIPIMFDKFIVWLNENILTFSKSQIAGFLSVLNRLCYDKNIKYILIVYSIKINLIDTIQKLLENQKEEDNQVFNCFYVQSIYNFLYELFEYIKLITNKYDFIRIVELTKLENPFDYLISHVLKRIRLDHFSKVEIFKGISKKLSTFITEIEYSLYNWISDNWIYRCNERLPPEQVKYFIEKVGYEVRNYDLKDIPQIPDSYSIKMVRYIMSKPINMCSFFLNKKPIHFVPLYYKMTCDMNNKLNDLKKEAAENPEDEDNKNIESFVVPEITPLVFCKQTLLKSIVKQINSIFIDDDNFEYIVKLAHLVVTDEKTLASVIEFLNENLNETFSNDILFESPLSFKIVQRTMNMVMKLLDKDEFKEKIYEFCDNGFINVILSPRWRNNSPLMLEVINFLNEMNKKIKLPIRVVQLISFLFIMKDEKLMSVAFKLCKKFEVNELQNLNDLLLNYFDIELQKEKVTPLLLELLTNVKSIIVARRPEMIEILGKLISLDEKDEKTINSIAEIFNALAPNRDNSISRTQMIEKSTIPENIREASPIFWDLFEKHSSFVLGLIEKDPLFLSQFNFLLKFPETLTFKIRSSYFKKKMKLKITSKEPLRLMIDRQNLLASSFECLHNLSKEDLLGPLSINYINERGIDAGGLRRDWFSKLSKELFNHNYALFKCIGNNQSYRPNSLSNIHPDHLAYFKFAGKFVALALINSQCIDAHFATSFCKQILHRKTTLDDLEEIDQSIYNSLVYIRDSDDVESLELSFDVTKEEFGEVKTIPLKENGENISVTNDNKIEYINLRSDYTINKIIKDQIDAFSSGFDSLISHDEIKFFTPNELDLLICGIPKIDVDDFIENTRLDSSFSRDTPVVKMFFNAISKWDNELLAKLLLFMTGSSRVPLNGFKEFCEITGHYLTISPGGDKSKLPQAHTCYNMLCLPEYESEEELNEKLIYAIQNSNSFEFA